MRKNALAMSIATLIGGLGFVGAASAGVVVGGANPISSANIGTTTATVLQLANGGIGHALLTPYFTAQNGNATIISLTNTDITFGKAVKVRFRGASNSDDILDFTVLMSPGDVWNATVTAPTGDNPAQITTSDRTCTSPQLAQGVAQPFVTARLTTKGGSNINNNTREGYVEIFNMADIRPGSALFTAVKHVNGVPPCTAGPINALLTNYTDEAGAAGAGLATPSTGLFGNWTIINVPQTTTYSGSMVAVQALTVANGPSGRGNFVLFPQSGTGYVASGLDINLVTADPLLRTTAGGVYSAKNAAGTTVTNASATIPAVTAAFYDLPDLSTPYVAPALTTNAPLTQASALTAALAVLSVSNEYATDAIVTAQTDWVFSMPTRRYSVAVDYAPTTPRRLYSLVPAVGNQFFSDDNTSINPANASQVCVSTVGQTFFDREETTKTSGAVFSPGNVTTTQFCGETSVLSFASSGVSVLGGSVARQDTGSSAFTNGWGMINTASGGGGLGLPILGSSFIKATNPSVAAGQSGTYGVTSEHRYTR